MFLLNRLKSSLLVTCFSIGIGDGTFCRWAWPSRRWLVVWRCNYWWGIRLVHSCGIKAISFPQRFINFDITFLRFTRLMRSWGQGHSGRTSHLRLLLILTFHCETGGGFLVVISVVRVVGCRCHITFKNHSFFRQYINKLALRPLRRT